MAKGQTSFRQLGKIDGRKYYKMKGVDGILSQSINEGMSNRVKNDAAYANTRRNNSEFGMAASTAGSCVKSLSQRWRYLLKPFVTATLAKQILAIAKSYQAVAWGKRFVTATMLERSYATTMRKYIKNDISDFGNLACSVEVVDDGVTLNLDAENIHNEKAEAAGCDGVRCVFVGGFIAPSEGGSLTDKALPATQSTEVLTEIDVPFGNSVEEEQSAPIIATALADPDAAAIGYVVLLPYREVGNEKVVMQEFASAIFANMPTV